MIKNQTLIKSNRSLLLVSLMLGALAALLIVVYLNNTSKDSGSTAVIPRVPVVVAKQNIGSGVKITPAMLEVRSVPTDAALVGAFGTVEELKDTVAQVPMVAGEQIIPAKVTGGSVAFAQFGNDPPLSVVVPSGMRGLSIRIDERSAAGGLVRPGDYVDLLMVTSAGDPVVVSTCYVLQNVQILAVAQDTQPTGGPNSGTLTAGASNFNAKASTATLAVPFPSVAAVSSASEKSVEHLLLLAVRPFGDHDVANVGQCAL